MNRTSTHYTDAVEKYLIVLMKNLFVSITQSRGKPAPTPNSQLGRLAWERRCADATCPAMVCQRNTVKRPNSVCRENPSTLPSESSACSGSATGKLPLTLRCASSPSSSTIRPG